MLIILHFSFLIDKKGKDVITIANLKQAKTDDDIKRLSVNSVKTAYHELALDYNHLLDLDYIYCPYCGKWKSTKGNSNFYKSKKSKSGFEHFACKSCLLDLCTDVDPKTGIRTDNREKTINTFRQLDWKFSESDYNAQLQIINEGVGEKVRGTAVQNLIVMVASLPQYNNTSYKDSEFSIDDIDNNSEANTKIVLKLSNLLRSDLETIITMRNLCILRRSIKIGRHVTLVKINLRNSYLNEYVVRNLR